MLLEALHLTRLGAVGFYSSRGCSHLGCVVFKPLRVWWVLFHLGSDLRSALLSVRLADVLVATAAQSRSLVSGLRRGRFCLLADHWG